MQNISLMFVWTSFKRNSMKQKRSKTNINFFIPLITNEHLQTSEMYKWFTEMTRKENASRVRIEIKGMHK